MSYSVFLLVFVVPPIMALALLRRGPAGGAGARARWAIPITAAIAFVYTTPWDNYLVYRGVWGYGNGRILGTIGYVPIEEYAFFLLQPWLTGLLLYRVLERTHEPNPARVEAARWWGALAFAAVTAWGAWLLAAGPGGGATEGGATHRGLYLGLILAWAGPVMLGLWLYAGPHVWAHRRAAGLTLALSTGYLWVIDRYAITRGIWDISRTLSFDIRPFGLPVEEAVFFLVTNVLCVLGILLFLHGDRIEPPWPRPTSRPQPPSP